jgi:hypothetical protein
MRAIFVTIVILSACHFSEDPSHVSRGVNRREK